MRSQIGIASYKAYNVTMHCCLAMIVILTILCMAFELGLLPVFCVGIVWMTQTVVYQTYARKAGKMLNSDDK